MSVYNYLLLQIICPRCGIDAEMEAEFRFGLRELTYYHIGDRLQWDGMGVKTPETRPDEGNYNDEAYVVCPHCERDFWLNDSIRNDIIVSATVDTTKQPYISDDEKQVQDWFSVPLQAGQVVRIETRYPGGAIDARTQADTQLAVFDPQGRRVAEDEDSGAGRNARVDVLALDQSGTWTLRVRSTDPLHRYGRYELRVPYSDPSELELEILRHGENVEVMEPARLRARIARRLGDAAKLYAGRD